MDYTTKTNRQTLAVDDHQRVNLHDFLTVGRVKSNGIIIYNNIHYLVVVVLIHRDKHAVIISDSSGERASNGARALEKR